MAQFSTLDQFLDNNNKGQQFLNEAKQEIQEHLEELVHYLDRYFPAEKQHLFSVRAAVFSG